MLDDAYDIKMDVDWSEELKGLFFFLSEVNEKERNKSNTISSFRYRQVAQPVQVFNLGNSLQVIKDTPLLKFP